MSLAASPAYAAPFQINVEPSYFTGNFGYAHALRIYEVPLAILYRTQRLRLRVVIPYVAIAGAGLISGGTVLQGGHSSSFRSGLGDVWLSAQYRLIKSAGLRPAIKPLIRLELPLASQRQGLGTGQFDGAFGARFDWRFANTLFPYAQFDYRINGRVPGLSLRNAVTYQAGLTLALPHNQYVTGVLIGHGGFQYHVGPTDSVVAAYNINLNPEWGLAAYIDRGLTSNSANFGAGFGVIAGF
ncbi:MAG: hypothetical protein PHT60_07675 [Acidiphilium sp.]|nr:hypothetical protein [Acidiphilium sp.]MDD4935642.1 hypothetical protein [Acidiphilium sp.]